MISASKEKWQTDKFWLTPYNWLDDVRANFDLPKRVRIHDVTLREGDQHPNITLRSDEKIRIARTLDELGVWSIEVIPGISKDDKVATKEITKLGLDAKVIAFVSWMKDDTDTALECDVDSVIMDFVGNPWQSKTYWGLSEEDHIRKAVEAIQYAKDHGLFVVALPWDNYRAPLEFSEKLYKALAYDAKADHVSISETFGFALPWTTLYLVKKVREWIPAIPIQIHGHNDFGLATSHMIAAVCGGAEVLHTTMCGIGERTGNAATEEVAVAIELLLGVDTGINLEEIDYTARLVQALTKFKVAPNKPIIGENVFTTGSGWIAWMQQKAEQAGMIQGMIPFKPELIGASAELKYVIGKGCGKNILKRKLKEMGIEVKDEQMAKILEKVKEESGLLKELLSESQIKKIVEDIIHKKS